MMFTGIRLFPATLKINFVSMRYVTYGLSIFVTLATIAGYFLKDINYGIDFTGGTLMETRFSDIPDLGKLRSELANLPMAEISLQEFGTPQDLLIRLDQKERTDKQQAQVIQKVKEILGPDVEYRRIETIGPKMGAELISNSIQATLWAMIAMLIYVWLRFEWQFGLCSIIALIHDSIGVLSLYTIFGLEFNSTTIVAILITIGYSINDTVVIYDRIRENLRKYKKMDLAKLVNISINETLSRTTLTSASTLIALLALYLFGGDLIASYSLPILLGIAFGTYSSIFLAAPLLVTLGFKVHEEEKQPEF
ncbi:MAG: protein translocase subunit SecF [Alphaproteobacteria bacterium]